MDRKLKSNGQLETPQEALDRETKDAARSMGGGGGSSSRLAFGNSSGGGGGRTSSMGSHGDDRASDRSSAGGGPSYRGTDTASRAERGDLPQRGDNAICGNVMLPDKMSRLPYENRREANDSPANDRSGASASTRSDTAQQRSSKGSDNQPRRDTRIAPRNEAAAGEAPTVTPTPLSGDATAERGERQVEPVIQAGAGNVVGDVKVPPAPPAFAGGWAPPDAPDTGGRNETWREGEPPTTRESSTQQEPEYLGEADDPNFLSGGSDSSTPKGTYGSDQGSDVPEDATKAGQPIKQETRKDGGTTPPRTPTPGGGQPRDARPRNDRPPTHPNVEPLHRHLGHPAEPNKAPEKAKPAEPDDKAKPSDAQPHSVHAPEQQATVRKADSVDSTRTEWQFATTKHSPIPMIEKFETGSPTGDFILNKVLLPWRNLLAAIENTPFEVMGELDEAMMRTRFAAEWQAFQAMAPLMRTMGIAVETGAVLSQLRDLARSRKAFAAVGAAVDESNVLTERPSAPRDMHVPSGGRAVNPEAVRPAAPATGVPAPRVQDNPLRNRPEIPGKGTAANDNALPPNVTRLNPPARQAQSQGRVEIGRTGTYDGMGETRNPRTTASAQGDKPAGATTNKYDHTAHNLRDLPDAGRPTPDVNKGRGGGSPPSDPRVKPKHGEPSDVRGGTEYRTGTNYRTYNAAEVGQGRLRIIWDERAGRATDVKYEVQPGLKKGAQVSGRSFAKNTLDDGAQSTNTAYNGSGMDKGHLAQREAFKGDFDAERAADHWTNVTPMHENLNRGSGSPWRAAEVRALEQATQSGEPVIVRIQPHWGPDPKRLSDGTPIAEGFWREHLSQSGGVIETRTYYPNQ